MKILILSLILLFALPFKGIEDVRISFQQASLNEENAILFNELVKKDLGIENNLQSAYLGASETLLAKYEKAPGVKLKLFKSGVAKIEKAIEVSPSNVELRLIRFMIQKNAPSIVKYSGEMKTDKDFILNNYNSASADVKTFVKRVANDGEIFTPEELTNIK